ncbi:BREX-1 system adenine-specific DNA-methyltransferase PglX [Methylophilus sp.]|uniref:BREX-1 system adenine-specific DNA-methyltransferase PglX n=1 Tax=Methylophilus sp. TaxID=29541 RepID=UPI0011D997BF|nr:BREX-1 system adenine-specific DNA-methyltransferase PglX [Methylophilus sp.]TXI44179.1 MAG: BREX-1 system adenine-specific DNA-methyltransferase PglX [Methylophilus sp.]
MNKNNLKSYAPQARKDFIAAVKARCNMLGLSNEDGSLKVAEANVSGDVAIIAGREWPAKVEKQRQALIKKMRASSFAQTVEAVAYTWFNRFVALRYMELHDYLDHGFRVLSSITGNMPEVLGKLTELQLDGLNIEYAKQLKLAGNKDGELYRLILIAQCNVLSNAMPFMFEQIDDETELLLPDNLLLTDSVIAKLVKEIPEADWAQVEIIGWLYQFYISEKKDEVIGKVVKSEDIPAATQLFTPNWIVQYMVQNSVGRLWTLANPSSSIHSQWPYYIKPAEQTSEVNAELQKLIDERIAQDGTTLNPESITVLDPACGSGHILVEAYECLKQIYLERGYQPRVIPRLILEKNLFGIDIDDRAAQLAGFALLMKARADDRRILQEPPKLNVISLQESKGLNADQLAQSLSQFGVNRNTIADLIDTFQHAKTFGSLIRIKPTQAAQLPNLKTQLEKAIAEGDLFAKESAQGLLLLIQQAKLLAKLYDAVVANPPYMGSKGMNAALKDYAKVTFPESKSDLFAMFIERGFEWCKTFGFNSMVTMQSWMFLSSYEAMREKLLANRTIHTMAHLGARAFSEISGEVVQTTSFVLQKNHSNDFKPVFFRLVDGQEAEKEMALKTNHFRFDNTVQDDFKKIPGSPVVYWLSNKLLELFKTQIKLGDVCKLFKGLSTGENERFIRFWYEVGHQNIYFNCKESSSSKQDLRKWYPCNKGGEFRKWYGNQDGVIDWYRDGELLRSLTPKSVIRSPQNYFSPSLSWSKVTSGIFSMRFFDSGFVSLDSTSALISDNDLTDLLACINSKPFSDLLSATSATLNYEISHLDRMPIILIKNASLGVKVCIGIAKSDWDSYETSWDFSENPLIRTKQPTLAKSFAEWQSQKFAAVAEMKRLEEENNRLFIDAYGLQDELTPEVPDEQITLTRADREKDSQRLISYSIGCMMGRYSLDELGLIYAHAVNEGFDASRYSTFPADADGIVPITDAAWFEDDATNRIAEFLVAVWGKQTLDENLAWLAESLGGKTNDLPLEVIRKYLSNQFYKDHLQTYKKRPIYWHFSSGKQGAFQALVYLHRYNEGTLARMRSEYVVPLMGKLKSRIEMLEKDANSATSTATRNKINKEIEQLNKKQFELQTYDEKLRHYADMRIKLDLDDGVKVNYGKFGDLLSDVKAITGGSDD